MAYKTCFDGYLTKKCASCDYWVDDEHQCGCACPFPIMNCEAFAEMVKEEERMNANKDDGT